MRSQSDCTCVPYSKEPTTQARHARNKSSDESSMILPIVLAIHIFDRHRCGGIACTAFHILGDELDTPRLPFGFSRPSLSYMKARRSSGAPKPPRRSNMRRPQAKFETFPISNLCPSTAVAAAEKNALMLGDDAPNFSELLTVRYLAHRGV